MKSQHSASPEELYITGTRGIPASHGGFETFVESFAVEYAQSSARVTVYCHDTQATYIRGRSKSYKGVKLVQFGCPPSPFGTILFDLLTILDILSSRSKNTIVLTLGYNTAMFNLLLNLFSVPYIVNMDGLEWKRKKWGKIARAWLKLNERMAWALANAVVCDHPKISEDITKRLGERPQRHTIPYGSIPIYKEYSRNSPSRYFLLVARIEPENSVLEIVQSFSTTTLDAELHIVGTIDESNAYHAKIKATANSKVKFLGPIYDKEQLAEIRRNAMVYIHGHTVGGTNPSLVEALASGNAIIANDNVFNRWVASESAIYFANSVELGHAMVRLCDEARTRKALEQQAIRRFNEGFTWPEVHNAYEEIIRNQLMGHA